MMLSDEEYKALPSLKEAEALDIAKAVYELLDEKKGKNIRILHVEDLTVLCKYFVICTGNSSTQVKSLAGEIEYKLGLRGLKPYNIEGRDNQTWIVADYSDVIVHVMSREARDFYNLDKLYGDAEEIKMESAAEA